MKLWKKGLLVLALVALVLATFLYSQVRSMEVESLSDDLHIIRGMGGNTTVVKTGEGNIVIDTMTFPMQGELIRAKAAELTGEETVLLINTHYHLDHTHGNPAFEPDIRVVATEKTLSHLAFFDTDFWEERELLMPNEVFSDQLTIKIGNKTLRLLNPGRGHTDGDLVVIIEEEGTVVMGDLLFYQHYPNIDLEAGGSIQEWPATLDRVMAEPFARVIPGHGLTTDRMGIRDFQHFIGQLAKIGRAAAADQSSLRQILEASTLTADAGYKPIRFAGISLGLNREFVLQRTWEESTGNFELRN